MYLMRNDILVETFGHPDIKENRTKIGLYHATKSKKSSAKC
jgi:hypothetical protein